MIEKLESHVSTMIEPETNDIIFHGRLRCHDIVELDSYDTALLNTFRTTASAADVLLALEILFRRALWQRNKDKGAQNERN